MFWWKLLCDGSWLAGGESFRKLLGERGCNTNWCIHSGHWSCEALKTVHDLLCVVYLGQWNLQQVILIPALLMPINTLITASLILLQLSPCTPLLWCWEGLSTLFLNRHIYLLGYGQNNLSHKTPRDEHKELNWGYFTLHFLRNKEDEKLKELDHLQ